MEEDREREGGKKAEILSKNYFILNFSPLRDFVSSIKFVWSDAKKEEEDSENGAVVYYLRCTAL